LLLITYDLLSFGYLVIIGFVYFNAEIIVYEATSISIELCFIQAGHFFQATLHFFPMTPQKELFSIYIITVQIHFVLFNHLVILFS